MGDELFEFPAPDFDAATAADLARDHYGIESTATLLVSERDQNFRMDAADGKRYVLKIANAAEDPDVVDYENTIMRHIASEAPDVPTPRLVATRDGSHTVVVPATRGGSHQVRLISWLNGTTMRNVEAGPRLRRALGIMQARLGLALRGLVHPASARPLAWDISRLDALRDKADFVEDAAVAEICGDFIDRFAAEIKPKLETLRAQTVHNDLNPSNVLVSENGTPRITGIVDFGDAVHAPLICDVAITAAYLLTDDDDPLAGVREFVAAYDAVVPLEPAEQDLLLDLIIARAVTTVVVASWRAGTHPENREYILGDVEFAAGNVRRLVSLDRAAAAGAGYRCSSTTSPSATR